MKELKITMPRIIASKYEGKSDAFIGVYTMTFKRDGQKFKMHQARLYKDGTRWNSKLFSNEREAALAYDKKCIELGLPPRNILKRMAGGNIKK